MSLMQRTKGKVWERAIATRLRRAFPLAIVRRAIQSHRAYEPDVVIEGNAPNLVRRLWLECQDARKPDPDAKLAQAERDCRAAAMWRIQVVVWHRYRERCVQATLRRCALNVLTGTPWQPGEFDNMAVTVDWEQLLDALRKLPVDVAGNEKAKEAA
jgi:hypothetical protein